MMNITMIVSLSVLIESGRNPRPILFFSFNRVNVFLLIVYLEKPEHASYELMMYSEGLNIIRMYEAGLVPLRCRFLEA